MKPVRQLVQIKHGSHLYGTDTPLSDTDYKGVHLPAGESILLNRPEDHIDRGVKVSTTVKNNKDDIDFQSYSLQKFLTMLAKGDTVATEILFAPYEMIVERDRRWEEIRIRSRALLNGECKGFVGYCKQQAAKYGIKGSRVATARDLVKLLDNSINQYGPSAKLGTLDTELAIFCRAHEFAEIVNIPTQQGLDLDHLEALGKKIPFTGTIKQAHEVFNRVLIAYGDRALQAEKNEGVDWKAMSHAVRVARQAIELLTTGHITFPRPDAEELLAIKQGKIDFKIVGALLEKLVEEVEVASLDTFLPATADPATVDMLVLDYHKLQVSR